VKTTLGFSCALIFAAAVFAQSPSATAKLPAQAAPGATVGAASRLARTGDGREYLVNQAITDGARVVNCRRNARLRHFHQWRSRPGRVNPNGVG
jgi:hypothetical protein